MAVTVAVTLSCGGSAQNSFDRRADSNLVHCHRNSVLFLITYKALVNAMGHAGLQWDHRLAGSGLLGGGAWVASCVRELLE